jgi:antitoxin MazE
MKIKIVKIGNSKGIRIPKSLLRQTGIGEEVTIEVKDNQIILKAINSSVRSGWESAFIKMNSMGDDKLLDKAYLNNQSSFDDSEWEW